MRRRADSHRRLAIDASHWRADGRPKVRYATRGEAIAAAEERGREAGRDLDVYECAFCSGWHMGRRRDQRGQDES